MIKIESSIFKSKPETKSLRTTGFEEGKEDKEKKREMRKLAQSLIVI